MTLPRSAYDRFSGSNDPDDDEELDDEGWRPPDCFDDAGLHVRRTRCSTCIFAPGNRMRLRPGRVRDMVEECQANDSYVPCHELLDGPIGAVCRGSFDVLDTTPLQLARRLGYVVLVDGPDDPPPASPIELLG